MLRAAATSLIDRPSTPMWSLMKACARQRTAAPLRDWGGSASIFSAKPVAMSSTAIEAVRAWRAGSRAAPCLISVARYDVMMGKLVCVASIDIPVTDRAGPTAYSSTDRGMKTLMISRPSG